MTTPGFRAEIQALRALAVALVVAFHVAPHALRGGYVGVDVFFVISGFLITSHLAREQFETGRIQLWRFYARRVRRLLPAALIVLAACLAICLTLIPASAQKQNLREIVFSTIYGENWALAANAVDYLGAAAAPSLVQHYWSLSAEEQFYIVWPLLIVLAGVIAVRRNANVRVVVITVLGIVTIGSLVYSYWITSTDPSWAYFVTPARAWEFAAGGLLAISKAHEWAPQRLGAVARGLLSWGGVAAIVASAILFTADTAFPGVAALVPVLGAVAVIMAGNTAGRWTPSAIGRSRGVQFVGGISYSVYLWHWPLVVAAPIVTGHPIGLRSGILIIIVTVVLAALSKKFVEDPFLRGRPASGTRWKTFALAGAAMASVIVVSVGGMLAIDVRVAQAASEREQAVSGECFGAKALLAACSNPRAVPPDLDTAFASTDYADTTLADCGRGTTIGTIGDSFECSFGDLEADQVVVVIGDSHAGHWIPALQRIGDQQDWRLVSMVRSSCPFTDVTPSEQGIYLQQCEDWKKDVYKRVEELQPDLVFVASLSPNGYLAAGFDPGTPAEMEEGYETSLARLAQTSAVIVLKDTPFMGTNMPDCLGAVAGGGDSCNRDRAEALDQNTDPLWEAAARIENVARVDLSSVFCDASTCFAVTGGVSIYRDHHHLSASFSASLAPQLETALLDQGVSLSSR